MSVFIRCNAKAQSLEILNVDRLHLLATVDQLVLADAEFTKDGEGLVGRLEAVWGLEVKADLAAPGTARKLAINQPWKPLWDSSEVVRVRDKPFFRSPDGKGVHRAKRVWMHLDKIVAEGLEAV